MEKAARLQKLEAEVKAMYAAKDERRAEWSDWLGAHHVPVVADNAAKLARQYGANPELSRAAALLHDIADVRIMRRSKEHEAESLKLARELLAKHGYTEDEIRVAVDDAIRYHSCHGAERPQTVEGKVLATADAMAHFQTDFYLYATWAFAGEKSLSEVKAWTLEKLERDLKVKVFFEVVRTQLLTDFQMLHELFSR